MKDQQSMRSSLLNLIEIEEIPWFENVGQKIKPNEVEQLFSWSEAWEHLQDENWINAPFHNTVDSWHEMWDLSYDKVLQVARRSVYDHEFESGITSADAAAYDVAAAAVEIATRKQPAFFTALMKWLKPAFSMWLGRGIPKWQADCVLIITKKIK